MLIRIIVEYDGTGYCGWQVQSGQDSIQARLERALERIFAQQIRVHGAGRTDAGVHARGQVAAFRLPRPFDPADLMRALNALLPPAITVITAACAKDSFDPRRDARSRLYEYRNEAAAVFLGEHDFAAMRSLGSDEKTTVRRVMASEWRREGTLLTYRVEATAFVRHMVRTMVAAMVDAGRRATTSDRIAQLLAGRDRASAPAPAPACGLYLVEVRY